MNGVNEFNPDIAKVRAYNFFKKSLTMTSIFRGSTKIDNPSYGWEEISSLVISMRNY